MIGKSGPLDLGDLFEQHQADFGILVPNIDVGVAGVDHPGGDQHAFDEAVRIAFEIIAILERAGLTLVGIDRKQPRRRLGTHKAPFAPGREAGAAEPAQSGIAHRLDDVFAAARACDASLEQRIAAVADIAVEVVRRGVSLRMRRLAGGGGNALLGSLHHLHMADRADRRTVAGAHARRPHHPHIAAEPVRQVAQQMLAAGHGTGQRIANPHSDRRRRRLAFLHHVEMRIEGRDLVDFGQRQLHLLGERGEMRCREVTALVLDQMQMLDQEIAAALAIAEERANFGECRGIDLAALGGAARPARARGCVIASGRRRTLYIHRRSPGRRIEPFHSPRQSLAAHALIDKLYRNGYDYELIVIVTARPHPD